MPKFIERLKQVTAYQLTQQMKNQILSGAFTHHKLVVNDTDILIATNEGLMGIDVGQWLVLKDNGQVAVMSNEDFTEKYQPI